MPTLRLRLKPAVDATFERGIRDIQKAFDLPLAFPAEVEATAARAAVSPRLPDHDRTDLPLVTIDPPGAMDLDQAMCLQRSESGYVVSYAIADVAAFVSAGDPVDVEAHRRGQTLYGADSRIPLHPPILSEGAASLLPMAMRPAVLWTLHLDARAQVIAADVRRARVMSRARFDYASVQRSLDEGTADPEWQLLREIGQLRQVLEIERGGVSLGLPAQEIGKQDGGWRLEYRSMDPIEGWNAQISLMAGMAAAQLMLKGKVGLLRTLPPPPAEAIARLRVTARALGIAWPPAMDYPTFIRTLDPSRRGHVAMMTACTTVLRGAGYAAFDGEPPAQPLHSAIAAPYAHVTAPLRRLGDRYASEACLAISAGQPVPSWVREALPTLPAELRESDRRANHYQRAIIDLAEALLLAPHIGESFQGSIVAVAAIASRGGTVMLKDLAIEAQVSGLADHVLGDEVLVDLVEADPVRRVVNFRLHGDSRAALG